MKVRDRYGDIREVPEMLGRLLVQRGIVTAVAPAKPAAPEPKKSRKAKEE